MPNRRHSSRRFTPSCSNSITNSCRCDMIDFSDHGTPAPPQQAKDADRMCPPCLRTPVHYLSGLYRQKLRGPYLNRRQKAREVHMTEFVGRIAVITGGGSGMGREL